MPSSKPGAGPDKAPSPRPVAVAIALRRPTEKGDGGAAGWQVCLVTSRKHAGRWVLPKGGVEAGETSRQAAVRELREEAGIVVDAASPPPVEPRRELVVADAKPHKRSPSSDPSSPRFVPRAVYAAHVVRFDERRDPPPLEGDDWPERGERRREWVGWREACQRLAWRGDVAWLLRHCGADDDDGDAAGDGHP